MTEVEYGEMLKQAALSEGHRPRPPGEMVEATGIVSDAEILSSLRSTGSVYAAHIATGASYRRIRRLQSQMEAA